VINLKDFIIPIFTLVLGFFIRILQERILEKKVALFHWMDNPAVFSDIPPKVSFQNLHISNRGKLPAKNIRVCLDDDLFLSHDVLYKPLANELFSEEKKDSVRILKFDRLYPKYRLVISFKSTDPLPESFLIGIKSDEMISKASREEKVSGGIFLKYFAPFAALGIIAAILMVNVFDKEKDSTVKGIIAPAPISKYADIKIITDKTTYTVKDKMKITYQVKNITSQEWRDLKITMNIRGFKLNYDDKYKDKDFLRPGEVFLQNFSLNIPKDAPAAEYKIILTLSAGSLDYDRIFAEEYILFKIK